MNRSLRTSSLLALLLWASQETQADIIVPGADGSDGALSPSAHVTIDLSLAANRDWDQPGPVPGNGVYDSEKWAVVFKYSSVVIPEGVTVTFKNHPSQAPVVWLVSGDVSISGTINVNGVNTDLFSSTNAPGGPGGFRGAAMYLSSQAIGSGGFGPGGGPSWNCTRGGSHATQGGGFYQCGAPPTYGNPEVIPLIGGSGGSGADGENGSRVSGGGGGGGAILLASTGTIALGGGIVANGGNAQLPHPYGLQFGIVDAHWAGSGGAIRLIADRVAGSGALRARGGTTGGGAGRIRIEGNEIALSQLSDPAYTVGLPGKTAILWPSDNAPTVRIVSVGAQTLPTDPRASLDFPFADATIEGDGEQQVIIEATNVPLDWSVALRVIPKQGIDTIISAEFSSGDLVNSIWTAPTPLLAGFSVMQVRAYDPAAAATASNGAAQESLEPAIK